MTNQQAGSSPSIKEGSPQSSRSWKAILSVLLLLVSSLCFLLAGSFFQRQSFLTRGIPKDLPQPVAHAGPELGINVYLHELTDEERDASLAEIRSLGIRHIKQPFYYNENFDWQAADRLIAAAIAHELSLIPLLDGEPARDFAPPADPAQFAAWTGQFAKRYGDTIQNYIIWDEPNLTSHWGGQPVNANEYGALLSAAAAAIRTADSDAVIIAAPLAPTEETGPQNLTETLYLQELYEAGAAASFDVLAAKPYGFSTRPNDRKVDQTHLNFSRAIAMRETMEKNGDGHKALWAGNWGWNSLPVGWTGEPSLWGQVSAEEQAQWTVEALERARREWPWMGLMFLENWQPNSQPGDPRWGFSIAGRPAADAVQAYLQSIDPGIAYPGFRLAQEKDPSQQYKGGWRFSSEYGADISQPIDGGEADRVSFTFWGTDAGLRVRRANFRARLYVTVDGEPANALPHDENGTALVLTSPDPAEDFLATIPVARDLEPVVHTMEIIASRGWDQWALNGFSVGYSPLEPWSEWSMVALLLAGILFLGLSIYTGRLADWGAAGWRIQASYSALGDNVQMIMTALAAIIVALTGWLTWGEQVAGMYRRLGDSGQLALTAAAASLFYITPSFFLYFLALAVLFVLITLRPAWGLALVALTFPFMCHSLQNPSWSIASHR